MTDKDTKDNPENTEETPNAAAATATTGAEGEEEKEFKFVEEPTFDIDYKGDCAYEVKVTIPPANEHKLSDDVFEELRHEAEVPGFRRGRAPRKLIEKKFSKAVRGDVEAKLVNAALEKLVTEKKLDPIGVPEIDGLGEEEKERKEGEPLVFTLKFEVRTKVELGKYRGIEIERPSVKIDDKDVDEAIDNYRNRFGVYESLEKGTAAEGDQVIIDFKGTIEGEEFPGGSAQNYPYILGSKRFFPEFEEALVGKKAGGKVKCTVTFPEDYSSPNLRGKTAKFEIVVNEIKRRKLPELNDEFAAQAGYANMADMKEKVAANMRESVQRQGNEVAESRALEAVIESSKFELPKSLVKKLAESGYEEKVKELREKHTPNAEIHEHEAELRAAAEAEAISTLKSWAVIQEIAEVEGIEIGDEDFEQEAQALSARTGLDLDTVGRMMGEEDRRSRYEMRILQRKVLAALLSYAKVTDKVIEEDEGEEEAAPKSKTKAKSKPKTSKTKNEEE